MADSVREKIMKNIVTTLQGITTGNGYNNTVALVQRNDQSGNTTLNSPYIVVLEGHEVSEASPFPLTSKTLDVHILVMYRIPDQTADTRSIDEILNSLRADVESAMLVDITRGGNSYDVDPPESEPFVPEDGLPDFGTGLTFQIKYRHPRNDVYTPA